MNYREDVNTGVKETKWTFFKVLPLMLTIVVILSIIVFSLKSIGLIGGTVVERTVFEQSYQRSEALKSRIAMDTAILAEIEQKLLNPTLDENTRSNLNAQASAARIRIATARSQQK